MGSGLGEERRGVEVPIMAIYGGMDDGSARRLRDSSVHFTSIFSRIFPLTGYCAVSG